MLEKNNLYTAELVQLSDSPRFEFILSNPDKVVKKNNPLCGDSVELFLKFDSLKIFEISFQATGCILCRASASLMTNLLYGKEISYARNLKNNIEKFLMHDSNELEKDLKVLEIVKNFPMRVKCVMLSWNLLEKGLEYE
ncbi:MAG: SUF system NifU family Fe-S cluster assembly protein [Leptospiraceae bacterium]|nr:SUF system NifU family Fe-S cluster assembly protein [Leptospiraceae bacterium]